MKFQLAKVVKKMTRVLSSANLKKRLPGPQKPKEGTNLRALYDLFLIYRGVIAPRQTMSRFYNNKQLNCALNQLRNFYGMDIRTFRTRDRGSLLPGELSKYKKSYALVGEYKDDGYYDYLAERQKGPFHIV